MRIHFIENAGMLWHRFYSVRFSFAACAAALFSGWEAHVYGQPVWACLLSAGLALLAGLSRIVAQPKARADCDG